MVLRKARRTAVAALFFFVAGGSANRLKAQTQCDATALYYYDSVSNWCYYGGDDCLQCYVGPGRHPIFERYGG
jgi:hypothetical protein